MMTLQDNIKAILDTNLTEIRDDIKDTIADKLNELLDGLQLKEVWVATRYIPESASMEFKFFSDEKVAKEYSKQHKAQGSTCSKYPLIDSLEEENSSAEQEIIL